MPLLLVVDAVLASKGSSVSERAIDRASLIWGLQMAFPVRIVPCRHPFLHITSQRCYQRMLALSDLSVLAKFGDWPMTYRNWSIIYSLPDPKLKVIGSRERWDPIVCNISQDGSRCSVRDLCTPARYYSLECVRQLFKVQAKGMLQPRVCLQSIQRNWIPSCCLAKTFAEHKISRLE
jgi:hypothetical protein